MRINKTKSKNNEHYSIIQDITKNGKRTTRVYENIGNYEKLKSRALKKKLNNGYTAYEIIEPLKEMNLKLENDGYYSPIYTRTNLTDKLHDEYQFRTDYEILSEKNLKKIFSSTKK